MLQGVALILIYYQWRGLSRKLVYRPEEVETLALVGNTSVIPHHQIQIILMPQCFLIRKRPEMARAKVRAAHE